MIIDHILLNLLADYFFKSKDGLDFFFFEDLNFYFVEISSEYLNLEGYLVAGGELLYNNLTR